MPIPLCVLCNCWLFADEPSYDYKDAFVAGKAHRECTPESAAKEALERVIAEVEAPPMTEAAKLAHDGTMGVVGMLSRKWGTEPDTVNLTGWDTEVKKDPWRFAKLFNDVTEKATLESRVMLGTFAIIAKGLAEYSAAKTLMPARPVGGALSVEGASGGAPPRPGDSRVPQAPPLFQIAPSMTRDLPSLAAWEPPRH